MFRAVSVPAMISCRLPFANRLEIAIPLAAWFGKAHGAGPNVSSTLKMFFPEGLGVTVPEKLQPDVLAVKLPVFAIAIDTAAPFSAVRLHEPTMLVNEAGVL